jgi:drug/metabolite transporter (DMT)-like permease
MCGSFYANLATAGRHRYNNQLVWDLGPRGPRPHSFNVNSPMKICRPTIIGIIAPLLWATSLPFIRQCSPEVGPFHLAAIQYLVSGVFGIIYFTVTSQKPLAVYSCPRFVHRLMLFTAYFVLLYPAIYLVQTPNFPGVLLLNYLWPTFTLLFTLALIRQPFCRSKLLLGTALVVLGLAVEILPSKVIGIGTVDTSFEPIPYAMAFAAAAFWGLYSSFNRKWGELAGGVAAVPLLMFSAGTVLLLLATLTEGLPSFSRNILGPLVYLCLMPFMANVAWDIGTRNGNLPLLSLVCDFIPWVALTMTSLYLEIPLGPLTLLSAFLIVIGAVISRLALMPARAS